MALNVYLTFFKNYTANDLRGLEKWYFVFCYGVPLIPAVVFLALDATANLGIYGYATVRFFCTFIGTAPNSSLSYGVGLLSIGTGCVSPSFTVLFGTDPAAA